MTKSAAERATELAADRTALAYERTYAAWLRTGLVALVYGVGAVKLLDGVAPGWVALFASILLLLFSDFAYVAGIWRQLARVDMPAPKVSSLPPGLLVAANLGLAAVALLALAGMVTTRFC